MSSCCIKKKGLLLFYLDLQEWSIRSNYQKIQKANFPPQHKRRLSKTLWQMLAWQFSTIPHSTLALAALEGGSPFFHSANSLSCTFLQNVHLFCITSNCTLEPAWFSEPGVGLASIYTPILPDSFLLCLNVTLCTCIGLPNTEISEKTDLLVGNSKTERMENILKPWI